jgi:hypothetical protein
MAGIPILQEQKIGEPPGMAGIPIFQRAPADYP